MNDVKRITNEVNPPIIISSLVSDKNIGFCSYIFSNTDIYLFNGQGILEIETN